MGGGGGSGDHMAAGGGGGGIICYTLLYIYQASKIATAFYGIQLHSVRTISVTMNSYGTSSLVIETQ